MSLYTTLDLENYIASDTGFYYETLGSGVPVFFQVQRSIRMELRDPYGVNDIIYAETLPSSGEPDVAYDHDGKYYTWDAGAWTALPLKLSDNYIRQMVVERGSRGMLGLIDFLIAGIKIGPRSFSAGAERIDLDSLSDILAFYQALRKIKENEIAAAEGTNTGKTLRTRRRPVGGIVECW
jgi:hypothetical protein